MGGRSGLLGPWPLAIHDHPTYFHSALVSRKFLAISGTTAGYDPSFMSGYPKSVVWPTSSTLPEVFFALSGNTDPALVYKLYVLVCTAGAAWLFAIAGWVWRLDATTVSVGTGLYLIYIWSDFPINYAVFGMVPYFVAAPAALAAFGAMCRYLEAGSWDLWLLAALLSSFAFLAHPTTAMIVAPALLIVCGLRAAAFFARSDKSPRGWFWKRLIGLAAIGAFALVLNGFWWTPGIFLASSKGASDFVLRIRENRFGAGSPKSSARKQRLNRF